MKIFPIIPIWFMLIICIILIMSVKKNSKTQILIIVFMFIINLRIMVPTNQSDSLINNLDILFVIDNTISMNAEDYENNNTRLYAVKKDCEYIIEKLNGARFSLITFNNTAKVVVPYVRDNNMIREAIDMIDIPYELYAKGTSLNTSLDSVLTSLKSSKKKENKKRILFFISDGEITDDSSLKSFSSVSKYVDNGAVLGYGTARGGYMKTKDKYMETENYIIDDTDLNYKKALSKMEEKNLQKIAKDIQIDYIHMKNQKRIDKKLKEIQRMVKKETVKDKELFYEDTYYFLMIPVIILLLFEWSKFRREII